MSSRRSGAKRPCLRQGRCRARFLTAETSQASPPTRRASFNYSMSAPRSKRGLPRTPDARAHCLNAGGLQQIQHLGAEFGVAVQDGVFVRASIRECLAQLLANPCGGRMRGDVEVQDLAAVVVNDEEAVQQTEGRRWHGEEVQGDDGFPVIPQECQPALNCIGGSGCGGASSARRCVQKSQSRASRVRHGSSARPRKDSPGPCA